MTRIFLSHGFGQSTFTKVLGAALAGVLALGGCVGGDPSDQGVEAEEVGSVQDAINAIDPSASIIVTDSAALARFPLNRVMGQIVAGGATAGQTALELYQQWWDTNNDDAHAFTSGPHCTPTLNGYAVDCPRQEGVLAGTDPFAGGADGYSPVALVNRFDLAPTSGRHCGEYRIVYAKNSGLTQLNNRNFLIFEGMMPNPNPSLKLEGCRPIAEFWYGLSNTTDKVLRASRLDYFYFGGITGLTPVVDANNYGITGGQIRTNQFMFSTGGQHWQLREYKMAKVCDPAGCKLQILQVPASNNPHGALFAVGGDPQSAQFQSDFVSTFAVDALANPTIPTIGVQYKAQYGAGQSNATNLPAPINDYGVQASGNTTLLSAITAKLSRIGRSSLTAQNIIDRATAQSCAGCHQLSNNKYVGGGITWPASLGFTHIDEQRNLSPALMSVFIPARVTNLANFIALKPPADETVNPDTTNTVNGQTTSTTTTTGNTTVTVSTTPTLTTSDPGAGGNTALH